MTQIGADGRPFISAPQGAIDTFSAYKLAAEQAKAGFSTETVTLPGGETVLATRAQLAAAAQGNPQQFGGQPQPQQPQPGGKPAPWRTGNPMIDAIAQTESNGNPNAVSPVGARGLMQVMPGTNTAPGFGVKPAGDGSESERTRVGQDYHGAMTERYKDPALAAIAYNWGPGNTDKWLSNGGDFKKLPAETQSYVAQVLTRNGVNGRGQAPQNTNPAPNQAPAQQSPTFGLKIKNQQEKDDKAAKSKAYETGLVEQAKADAEKRNPKMVWNESLGTFVTPTSREVMPALDATGKPVPYNKTEKNLTEGERKAATLLKRLEGSEKQLNAALVEKPSAAKPGIFASTLRSVGAEALANTMAVGSERQRVESAQLDILDAALTLGTGAAYTKEQLEGYRRSYFPQLGDSKENVKDKKDRLDNVIQAAKIAAGRAAPQATGAQNPAPKKDVPAQPMRGMVMDGFKFKGGDPSKQSNWEKQ